MQANVKKERIRTQLKEIKRLDSCITKAYNEIQRLTRQKNKITLRVAKDIADDIISSNKKYIGKWVTAVGVGKNKWCGAEFLIKPSGFIRRERLDNGVLVLVEGKILYKYPNSIFGKQFKLFGYSTNNVPYIPGKLTLSMNGKYLIKIKRVATKKELDENKDTIALCEKYIADANSKGDK